MRRRCLDFVLFSFVLHGNRVIDVGISVVVRFGFVFCSVECDQTFDFFFEIQRHLVWFVH